ncbi:lysine-specific demethylase 2A-like isoform X3 [Macrobrachium rosenbergii]|uniref:lysine-specific demethylase 2A-like isoform X3 n=1 Tax=Macrobrachium rosenbergii TaxID=79674 RepID=UPI0034D70DA0
MASSRSTGGGTILASGIRTRERKERKLYSDDWALGDEEIEGHQTFDLEQKIKSDKFDSCFVKDMTATEYNLKHVQKHGFNWPLLFKDKSQLGITVPSSDFTINDVRLCVGSRRMLDVMDVNTQKNVEMTMKDWQRYFESQDKDKLLNVISLEFSHTKLEQLVQAPTVVRQIDWVERVWPRHLKEAQTEATNVLEDMMYPKVQKYCLMSVGGCYTDFHIDFGGTSVWYHILRGRKIFWLIPPTERNFQLYEQWVLSGKQSDIFFGDTVDRCARIELEAGNTFFIPTGWIHAVYTPEDSLVFGGNFLHSFGIEKQLRVAQVEDATHVPQKFRYPFFTEMLWYVLERYVHVLLGRTHLSLPPDEEEKYKKYLSSKAKANNNNQLKEVKEEDKKPDPEKPLDSETKENENGEHVHLTQFELHGLKAIVMYLHALPTSKKCVPDLITDPIALIRDVRTVVEKHRYDIPEKSLTCKPVLEWWPREPARFGWKRPLTETTAGTIKKRRRNSDENRVVGYPPNVSKIRHRRVRCKLCEPCTRDDCRQCLYCLDMIKYGGAGVMKQSCKMKKCTQPMLPAAAICYECELDGWGRTVSLGIQKPPPNVPNSLFECCVCYKVSHLSCLSNKFENVDGIVNEDLPNSWECPECVKEGYNKDYKHNRVPGSRASVAGSDTGEAKTPSVLSDVEDPDVKVKLETADDGTELKKSDVAGGKTKEEANAMVDTAPPHMPTWEELQARVSRPLVRPMWVVRPNPPPPPDEEEDDDDDDEDSGSDGESRPATREPLPPPMNRSVMLPVFHHLSVKDLKVVMQVCRAWSQWAIHPTLWKTIRLNHKKIHANHLMGIVRRQPNCLDLSWSKLTKEQLSWLLARLPQLQELHLEGQSWQVISCLTSPYCPPLSVLNISYCEGLNDATLNAMLSPPRSHRPGHRDTTTRLRQLTNLRLSGTQVGDEGVRSIVRSLPFLSTLNLSSCLHITELTAALLAHPSSVVSHSLSSLDLRGCHRLAPTCLPSLKCLPLLAKLALHPCSRIPFKAIQVWGKHHGYSVTEEETLTRIPPPPPDPTDDPMSDSDISSFSNPPSPTTSESKQIQEKAKTSTENEELENKDKNVVEDSKRNQNSVIDSKTKCDISAKKSDDESLKTSTGDTSNNDKVSENAKDDSTERAKCINIPVVSNKSTESKKPEVNANLTGSLRVSTRRQSRLHECDSDSASDINAEKMPIDPNVKKVQSEVKNERNSNSSEQSSKRIKASLIEQPSISKSSASQDKYKEKSEPKQSPPLLQDIKDNKPCITDKNESVHSHTNEDENLRSQQQCIKSEPTIKEETENTVTSQQGKNTKIPSLTKSEKTPPENTGKNENSYKDGKKEELLSQSNTKDNDSDPKSACEIKGNAAASDKVNKKSSSGELTGSKVATNSKDKLKDSEFLQENSKKEIVSDSKQTSPGDTLSTTGSQKCAANSSDLPIKKGGVSIQDSNCRKTDTPDSDKKKQNDKKVTQVSKSSDSPMNQKNVIVTSVEVHHAENYDSTQSCESSAKRPERRLSIRRSKDEPDLKTEEKQEKKERITTDSLKEKRRDSKSREEEMNRITVEDSHDKESKALKKRMDDKERKANTNKKGTFKPNYQTSGKVKQEKDIITRSTKRLKSEKEVEDKHGEQIKEENSPKTPDKSVDMRKIGRKSKDSSDDKEELSTDDSGKKDIKSPKPVSARKDKDSVTGRPMDKKDDDKIMRRNRSDAEEYMSKLRRKSHDSDSPGDVPSTDTPKKEENVDEKIRSRRRSLRDDDYTRGGPEKKLKDDAKEEKKTDTKEPGSRSGKNNGESENVVKQTKRKSEDTDESETSKKVKEDTDEGSKCVKKPPETMRERSGSRERPERAHRSPRRLSMCQ